MIGFKMAGRAFCVCEDLRLFAEQHKGQTVAEALKLHRVEKAEAKQFGMSLDEYRKYLNVKKEG